MDKQKRVLYLIVEMPLRMFVRWVKPVTFAHTSPGSIGDYLILPRLLTRRLPLP